tara:strand:+ start:112 stop:255 length:144 start_codon:yes stop_codon:yes gene_type:complete
MYKFILCINKKKVTNETEVRESSSQIDINDAIRVDNEDSPPPYSSIK